MSPQREGEKHQVLAVSYTMLAIPCTLLIIPQER